MHIAGMLMRFLSLFLCRSPRSRGMAVPAMQLDAHFNDVSGERGSGNNETSDAAEHAIGMSLSLPPSASELICLLGSKIHREQIVLMQEQTGGALDAINAVFIDLLSRNGKRCYPPFLHFKHTFCERKYFV